MALSCLAPAPFGRIRRLSPSLSLSLCGHVVPSSVPSLVVPLPFSLSLSLFRGSIEERALPDCYSSGNRPTSRRRRQPTPTRRAYRAACWQWQWQGELRKGKGEDRLGPLMSPSDKGIGPEEPSGRDGEEEKKASSISLSPSLPVNHPHRGSHVTPTHQTDRPQPQDSTHPPRTTFISGCAF